MALTEICVLEMVVFNLEAVVDEADRLLDQHHSFLVLKLLWYNEVLLRLSRTSTLCSPSALSTEGRDTQPASATTLVKRQEVDRLLPKVHLGLTQPLEAQIIAIVLSLLANQLIIAGVLAPPALAARSKGSMLITGRKILIS